ncbi:hypothetical protein EB796_020543 [Bugula neritina]|uniref:Uncharacterized protein n=1 Tax=Bugula neritina TaxID=10212 RepID=A0A7J7J4X3_BUGNE|nr:hypothetical protein EB796_020543 [Bugula neritina]
MYLLYTILQCTIPSVGINSLKNYSVNFKQGRSNIVNTNSCVFHVTEILLAVHVMELAILTRHFIENG